MTANVWVSTKLAKGALRRAREKILKTALRGEGVNH